MNKNEITKRQAEVLKEILELHKDIKDIYKETIKIEDSLSNSNLTQMKECAISIKNKYPRFYDFLPQYALIYLSNIAIEDMSFNQVYNLLILEIIALHNLMYTYAIYSGIKTKIELNLKWRLEDLINEQYYNTNNSGNKTNL